MTSEFNITIHAIKRLFERFEKEMCHFLFTSEKFNKKYTSKREIKEQINQWKDQIESRTFSDMTSLKFIFKDLLSATHEDRSHLNNSKYMTYLYTKYGFDRKYTFYHHPQMKINFVFVDFNEDTKNMKRLMTVF